MWPKMRLKIEAQESRSGQTLVSELPGSNAWATQALA